MPVIKTVAFCLPCIVASPNNPCQVLSPSPSFKAKIFIAAEFLGFLNRTCKAGTSPQNYGNTVGPVLRASTNGKQWKQWTLKAVSKPAANGAVDVTIANYYPLSGKPR